MGVWCSVCNLAHHSAVSVTSAISSRTAKISFPSTALSNRNSAKFGETAD